MARCESRTTVGVARRVTSSSTIPDLIRALVHDLDPRDHERTFVHRSDGHAKHHLAGLTGPRLSSWRSTERAAALAFSIAGPCIDPERSMTIASDTGGCPSGRSTSGFGA
jgi:hypothetical protein